VKKLRIKSENDMELSRKELKELMPGYFVPPKKREKKHSELDVHSAVCKYLKLKNLMFISDFAAGIKMTQGMAMRQKSQKSDHDWPDIFVAEPRGNYHGLFLELKRDRDSLYNKDGSMKKSDHLTDQLTCLNLLNQKGYYARFACGTDEAIQLIEDYLKL